MSQSHDNDGWHRAVHGGAHLLTHALGTERGKHAVRATAGTVVAAVAAAPVLLPVLAIGSGIAAAIWWWKKC